MGKMSQKLHSLFKKTAYLPPFLVPLFVWPNGTRSFGSFVFGERRRRRRRESTIFNKLVNHFEKEKKTVNEKAEMPLLKKGFFEKCFFFF